MPNLQTVEVPISGMNCSECTLHVQHAIEKLPGVTQVNVLLAAEKAIIRLDPTLVDALLIRQAVEGAGYQVAAAAGAPQTAAQQGYTRRVLSLIGLVFGAVLFVVVVGEWFGLFEQITGVIPFWLGLLLVVASGWPVFANVVRAAMKRQVTSHTLMSLGVLAALAVGQWTTAAVVVFFMRVGEYVETFTAEGARRAVKELTALTPQTARVERDGVEQELPIGEVHSGDLVVVRPGERIAVDGEVVAGRAVVDQATITGESLPVLVEPGSQVYAATLISEGSLRVRTARSGPDTTFGKVVKLVEEAEAQRADVQRFADKFTTYYLPVVAGLAALTLIIRRDPLATAAVLLVACSCSIALATPIAMLASVGAAARRGLLIKGGKYLETLARADTLLIDKTGTLTLGRPHISAVIPFDGCSEEEVLALAAAAERDSEHLLAHAVRTAAEERGLAVAAAQDFTSAAGLGVTATVAGRKVAVGSRRFIADYAAVPAEFGAERADGAGEVVMVGASTLYVACDGHLCGWLAAADTLRPEAPAALAALRRLGVKQIEMLTGDNEATAAALAAALGGIAYRANLLPEDKIRIVREQQALGRVVVMVGDGVNDAPALAQADVGIAMGAAGADIALEAAHVALMRDDWSLVPELFAIAQRTMGVVRANLLFTAIYNVLGLTLAALGLLPPIWAAAAQSLPDLGILANSARLLRPAKSNQDEPA